MSSREVELLLSLDRGRPKTLRSQIEGQLRELIRTGALKPGVVLPSSRQLSGQLGVSRPLVSEAYAQLAAEGYLAMRQGALALVAEANAGRAAAAGSTALGGEKPVRHDFRIGAPDLAAFPKALWLGAMGRAMAAMQPADFGYVGPHGVQPLQEALAAYLGRVRGVVARPEQVVITGGFEQGRSIVAAALFRAGISRVAVESPGYINLISLTSAGHEIVRVAVDCDGISATEVAASGARAVLLTPAHQYPTGVLLGAERRHGLLNHLRACDGYALEDDYDAEFRYDRRPVAALQGLDPQRVIYAGSVSKTLAPALRIGWLVVPPALLEAVQEEQRLRDYGINRIDQHALARLIVDGDYDRHLRRMRLIYRSKRQALLEALVESLPDATVSGIAAGLQVAVRLAGRYDEARLEQRAAERSVAFNLMSRHYAEPPAGPTTLLLGYTRLGESGIRAGVRSLAALLAELAPQSA